MARQVPGLVAVRRIGRPSRAGLLIAVGVLLTLALGIWLASLSVVAEREARDAFPMVSGQLRVEGLRGRVEIARDERGVPHVLAEHELDAWYGLGFAHAQDRLAQMAWLRRIAQGRVAERLGEVGLASDRVARTIGFARLARMQVAGLETDVARALDAYAAGVNARIARIASGRVSPPVELVRGPVPRPDGLPMARWTPADSLAVGKLVAWSAGASYERSAVLGQVIERLGSLGARPFFPGADRETLAPVALDALSTIHAESPEQPRRPLLGAAAFRASAWALPGTATASGAPILAAEFSVSPTAPSLLYQAHIRGGDIDTAGVTIPGLPVFWAGRNASVAWAASPLPVATVDLFRETLRRRPADDPEAPGRLEVQDGDAWIAVREREESIRVAASGIDEARVETLRVGVTGHGPLVTHLLEGRVGDEPMSLAWTGLQPGEAVTGLLRLVHAKRADEVLAALEAHHEPVVEVVYADRAGEVGLKVAGWLPRRALPSGLVPVPGHLPGMDWRAPIEPAGLPEIRLPAGDLSPGPTSNGVSSSAAKLGVATGTRLGEVFSAVSIEWLWLPERRAEQLQALLSALVAAGPVDLRAALAVQRNVSANRHPMLIDALLSLAGTAPELSPEASEVADLLRSWDGDARVDSRAAAAYQLLLGHLSRELLLAALGPQLLHRYLTLPGVRAEAIVEAMVIPAARQGRPGGWTDPDRVAVAVREGLRRTWMSLTYRLGHNRARWTWGRLHLLAFRPFGSTDLEAPPRTASLGRFPMPGVGTSLLRAEHDRETFSTRLASTYRMAVDLSAPDRMLTALAPGQSEHPGHEHYDSGVEDWREARPSLIVTSVFLLEEAAVERVVLEPSQ